MIAASISKFVPGAAAKRNRSTAVFFSVLFYGYLAVVVTRAGEFARLLRSPTSVDVLGAFGVAAGLAALYAVAVLPGIFVDGPSAKVFAERVRRFRANRAAVAGFAVFTVFVVVSLLAPLVAPYDPAEQNQPAIEKYQPPSVSHIFGTDKFGRDVFSRVVFGGRVSLAVGVLAVVLASCFGLLVGAFAGYTGGWVDELLMRVVDGLLSFPRLLLLLTLVALFANSFWVVVVVLAATGWMGVARLVRAEVLSLKEREFVQAAVATGVARTSIVWRHIIPNALGPVIVSATLRIALIILLESYLSFLGLGVQPPTPSWGGMVFEGRDVLLSAWWVSFFPGLAIVLAVMACNLLGDGLRDAMDVKLG
jgi:peptide/nickel transport system permease protein